jgi:hypothetical protein
MALVHDYGSSWPNVHPRDERQGEQEGRCWPARCRVLRTHVEVLREALAEICIAHSMACGMVASSLWGVVVNLFAFLVMTVLLIGALVGRSAMLFMAVSIVALMWVLLGLIVFDDWQKERSASRPSKSRMRLMVEGGAIQLLQVLIGVLCAAGGVVILFNVIPMFT